jgi:hypothetical protein
MAKTRHKKQIYKHKTMRHSHGCQPVTFHCLHKWMEEKFEKLGWMILAKKMGHTDKITSYLHSLDRLKNSITHKMEHMRDTDKGEDLEIMLYNVNILCEHATKDLK